MITKNKILTDIKIALSAKWDKSFEDKAFAGASWTPRKFGKRGSLLIGTGALRRSLKSTIEGDRIVWRSEMPYGEILNTGGEITITAKMKRFFWAKYYEASGKIRYRKDGKQSKTSTRASDEAEFFKALALKKVGDKIVIPARPFIGDSSDTAKMVKEAVEPNMVELERYLADLLKVKN